MPERNYEKTARESHRNGTNCARSVYDAFSDVNMKKTFAPMPRSEGGTSLEVGSAANLAHMFHGKYLVIINKSKTKMEGMADLVFHGNISMIDTWGI